MWDWENVLVMQASSANQRPNTPCIRLWIDVTFRGLEHSYTNRTVDIPIWRICKLEKLDSFLHMRERGEKRGRERKEENFARA